MKKINKLFYILLPLGLGIIVSLITKMDYNNFVKPPLSPPAILFPIAWTILYLLIGYSYYDYKKNYNYDMQIDILYYSQLGFNMIWSIVFFTFKNFLFALIVLIVLDILVVMLMKRYLKINKLSFYLLIPYLVWILFATYLNIGIYLLN